MNIENLIKCMSANDVDYDKNFVNAEKEGCISNYQELFNKLLSDIESSLRFGVNNGFSGDLKDGISRLTKITVKICNEKNGKKVNKFTAERDKIQKECEKIMKKSNSVDIKGEVLKYVDAYIQGTETVFDLENAESRKPILQSGIEKLQEIKLALNDVVDVSTSSALDSAKNVIAQLKVWAKAVTIEMHNSEVLSYLDKALALVKKWSEIRTGVKKGLFGRDNSVKNIDEIAFNAQKEDLYQIAKSRKVMEQINNFAENLEMFKKDIASGKYSAEEDKTELKEIIEKIKQLKSDKENAISKYKNGEIDKDELYDICINIDAELKDLESDEKFMRNNISSNKGDERLQKRVLAILERVNRAILSHKREPVIITHFGTLIDFESLYRIMHGIATERDMQNVFTVNDALDRLDEMARRWNDEFADEWRNVQEEAIRREREFKQSKTVTEEDIQRQKQEQKEKDDYLANLLGKDSSPNNEVKSDENKNDNDLDFIFSDDDK